MKEGWKKREFIAIIVSNEAEIAYYYPDVRFTKYE